MTQKRNEETYTSKEEKAKTPLWIFLWNEVKQSEWSGEKI